ncbi:MAG: hypothetical protein ABIJ43_04665 [Candidatus Beckwithbacteria bacterium]|nr:hypothetical protein [Patescibacteria group bacterium]
MPKKSSNFLAAATLTGTLLLSSGSDKIKSLPEKPLELRAPLGLISTKEIRKLLADKIKKTLPQSSRILTEQELTKLSQDIKETLGVKAYAELDGNRLNHQVGYMGLEQHLLRFPGDTITDRDFQSAGIASGKGAWGYFAESRAQMASSDIEREKYYLAVQTLYLPDWKQRLKELRDWYKYRKVLVINPDNGRAVVAVIADAGPAKWTGKQFGGSPQVMYDLDYYPTKHKGKTIVLFIDDQDNKIPLGPITRNLSLEKSKTI